MSVIGGTVYGIVLNDEEQLQRLTPAFAEAPYHKPPVAPVLYIKPRGCVASDGASVEVPAGCGELEVAATLGLLFDRDLTAGDPDPIVAIGGVCIAVDVSEPTTSYYRPALVERCRDGFLPVSRFAPAPSRIEEIELLTAIDDREVHRWSLRRLRRNVPALLKDISDFMTLAAGDLLLVGLAGDAPRARPGARVAVRAHNLPTLTFSLQAQPIVEFAA